MSPAPRIGTQLAGYRIDGLVGRGGMGVVYRAEHPRLGVTLALKVMDSKIASDEEFRERFVREARLAARVRHPSIVPIYDAGEADGELYITMGYIEGEDLKAVLRREGPLPAGIVVAIGRQIAGALDAAHRSGLVHRDVKPANVIVEPGPESGDPPTAFLADLGLSKRVDAKDSVTGSGEVLGTIDYLAPEQIEGARVDGRADLYSLACVLFECLTGSPPFVRENKAAVLWAHLHDEPPRPSSLNAVLPAGVDAAIGRGMAKDPAARQASARELVAVVAGALEEEDRAAAEHRTAVLRIESPPTRSEVPAPPRTHTRRRGLLLAAVAGALVGGGVAAGVVLGVGDDPAATTAPTRQGPEATTQREEASSLTPFDQALLPYVPDTFRASCRHADPVSQGFDSTVSCSPGGVVRFLTYSHARSGFYLFDHLMRQTDLAGIPVTDPVTITGRCQDGEIPSFNSMVASGLAGRDEVLELGSTNERIGFVLCYRSEGEFHVEWSVRELGVYAHVSSTDRAALYDWWRTQGGPEP